MSASEKERLSLLLLKIEQKRTTLDGLDITNGDKKSTPIRKSDRIIVNRVKTEENQRWAKTKTIKKNIITSDLLEKTTLNVAEWNEMIHLAGNKI